MPAGFAGGYDVGSKRKRLLEFGTEQLEEQRLAEVGRDGRNRGMVKSSECVTGNPEIKALTPVLSHTERSTYASLLYTRPSPKYLSQIIIISLQPARCMSSSLFSRLRGNGLREVK